MNIEKIKEFLWPDVKKIVATVLILIILNIIDIILVVILGLGRAGFPITVTSFLSTPFFFLGTLSGNTIILYVLIYLGQILSVLFWYVIACLFISRYYPKFKKGKSKNLNARVSKSSFERASNQHAERGVLLWRPHVHRKENY